MDYEAWVLCATDYYCLSSTLFDKPSSYTIRTVFAEFSSFLESAIVMSSDPLLVTGDFNIHVDEPGDPDGDSFLVLQHVTTDRVYIKDFTYLLTCG